MTCERQLFCKKKALTRYEDLPRYIRPCRDGLLTIPPIPIFTVGAQNQHPAGSETICPDYNLHRFAVYKQMVSIRLFQLVGYLCLVNLRVAIFENYII